MARLIAAAIVGTTAAACRGAATATSASPLVLRVGISTGQLSATNPLQGISQIVQNQTTEALARVTTEGRMEPQLADKWTLSPDRRRLRVELRRGVHFSDGSSLDAAVLAPTLATTLRDGVGRPWADGVQARAVGPLTVEVELPHPSPFWIESLEAPIRKRGGPAIATGPFRQDPQDRTRLRATDDYYLGRPIIDLIDIKSFPSVRSAWAELLRNNIDLLYEVGPEGLDALGSSTTVSVFTFVRPYQYNVTFNAAAETLRSPAVRQALNFAIDRNQLVRVALNGHGETSTGPIRHTHWASPGIDGFSYDPQRAARLLNGRHVRFTCLLVTDAVYERIALEVKRQLAAVGVEMELKSLAPDEFIAAQQSHSYEAALQESISGPSMLRLYTLWHTHGALNVTGRGTKAVDAALDQLRDAADDEQYRHAVVDLQKAFMGDPPAILLAWSERARAVSNRFVVPQPDPNRPDVLATLRLWKPRNDARFASRN